MKIIVPTDARSAILTDETLISLVLSGQENAYTILVRRYERMMHSVIQHYLPNYEVRQEVVQGTFIRSFRVLSRFRAECKFSTWLSKIARPQAVNRHKVRRHFRTA